MFSQISMIRKCAHFLKKCAQFSKMCTFFVKTYYFSNTDFEAAVKFRVVAWTSLPKTKACGGNPRWTFCDSAAAWSWPTANFQKFGNVHISEKCAHFSKMCTFFENVHIFGDFRMIWMRDFIWNILLAGDGNLSNKLFGSRIFHFCSDIAVSHSNYRLVFWRTSMF